MDHSNKFSKILKSYGSNGVKRFPEGILNTKLEPPNYEICNSIISNLNTFLARNKEIFRLKDPYFDIIQSHDLNACHTKDETDFFGITKGLIDCCQFVFTNFLRDSALFNDELGSSDTDPVVVTYAEFSNWHRFLNKNNIDYSSFTHTELNPGRRSIANALFSNCLFFILMHEVGHVKHNKRNARIVKEMDADMFSVNQLVRHFTNLLINNKEGINSLDNCFYKSKKTIFRYTTFIFLTIFFILDLDEKPKIISPDKHPTSAFRCLYSVAVLKEIFLKKGFLNSTEINECGIKSFYEFRKTVKYIYPSSQIDSFFQELSNTSLGKDYSFLETIGIEMSGLNSNGKF